MPTKNEVLIARRNVRRAAETLAMRKADVEWHRSLGIEDSTSAMQRLFDYVVEAEIGLDVALANLERLVGVSE